MTAKCVPNCPYLAFKMSLFCPDFAQKGLSRSQFWLTKGPGEQSGIVTVDGVSTSFGQILRIPAHPVFKRISFVSRVYE